MGKRNSAPMSRLEALALIEVLCGRSAMIAMDGRVAQGMPMRAYLRHLDDAALLGLVVDLQSAAGITVRARARLDAVEFLRWRKRNFPQEVGKLDQIAAEFGLDVNLVEETLYDLAAKAHEHLPSVPPGAGGVHGKADDNLVHPAVIGAAIGDPRFFAVGHAGSCRDVAVAGVADPMAGTLPRATVPHNETADEVVS